MWYGERSEGKRGVAEGMKRVKVWCSVGNGVSDYCSDGDV